MRKLVPPRDLVQRGKRRSRATLRIAERFSSAWNLGDFPVPCRRRAAVYPPRSINSTCPTGRPGIASRGARTSPPNQSRSNAPRSVQLRPRPLAATRAVEDFDSGLRRRFGRIDYLHSRAHRAFDQRPQQRVVCAAEHQRVGIQSVGCGLGTAAHSDKCRSPRQSLDGRSIPPQQAEPAVGRPFRARANPCLTCRSVSMAVHGGFGRDHQHIAGFRRRLCSHAPGSITPRTGTGTAS